MSWSIEGRTALVTGAARGIGADVAWRLARRGMNVSLVGLEPEELERVAARCGDAAAWFEADVTDREAVVAAVEGTVERFGGVDVVIANAGIASSGMTRAMGADAWERVVEVNLLGAFRSIHACLPHVVARRGYVLAVSSVAAIMRPPGISAYTAAKAGLEGFTDSLAVELGPLGTRVGCAYFSWIETDMGLAGEDHPVSGTLSRRLPPPMRWRYSIEQAGEALARGVERRSRRVMVPGWLRLLYAARALSPPIVERAAAPNVRAADEIAMRELERGRADELAQPVGRGGAADLRARRSR